MFRCDEARVVDDVSFLNLFLEELPEVGNVCEDLSSKMLDVVSNEVVVGDLASGRLLALLESGSSSLGLLDLSSSRYFSCHEIFSSFNFITRLLAPSLAFVNSSRSDLSSSLSSLRTVIL